VIQWQYESELAAVNLEYRRQMRLLRRVLEARPNFAAGWMSLTDVAMTMTDFDSGIDAVEHLLAIYTEQPDPVIAITMILALQRMERYESSAEFAQRAIRDFPGNVGVAYQAHRTLLWAGETAAAAKLLPALAEDQAGSAAIVIVRQACAEGRRDDAEQAAEEYFRSLENPKTEVASWHLYTLLGRFDDAEDVIRQTTSPDVLYSRAAWLFYRQFDPAPFPELLALLEREQVERKPTLQPPFMCS